MANDKQQNLMQSSKKSNRVPEPAERIVAYERLAYGLFLHWGLYSQLGRGEWVQHTEDIPWSEYDGLMSSFTAEDFDARAWARLAREAGMGYACLTARHHEGFSLYDTRGLSDFDAPHSAAKRDLVGEFVEGCRAEGIVPFLYHTTLDWRMRSHDCSDEAFHSYLDYLIASVEILCVEYGEIGGFWFDGNWSRKGSDWREDELYGMIRKHQPNAIIANNSGLKARGAIGHPELDTMTFEQGRPTPPSRKGALKYLTGEMCQTMNRHWGIGGNDFRYKSVPDIIETLCACRKVGADYLLNVGPTAHGGIPDLECAMLRCVGAWMRKVGAEILKDGRPFPAACQGRDFVLETGDGLYYFAHDLERRGNQHVVEGQSDGEVRSIGGIDRTIRSVRWLDNDEALEFSHNPSVGLTAIRTTAHPYGNELVVRVAVLH